MDFLTSLINVALLIAMAVPGFVLRKTGLLKSGSLKPLVVVLMYVAQPFLTVSSFAKKVFEMSILTNMGWVALLSFVLLVIAYFVSRAAFIFPRLSKPADESGDDTQYNRRLAVKRVCVVSSFMNNCGFMGIPVIQAFFPGNSEMIIYVAVFLAVFNLISWTLSIFVLTGDKKHMSIKKALLNPPTVALIVALPIFFTKTVLPLPVASTVNFLGDMTTPISMIILGIRLAEIKILSLFTDMSVYISSLVKLIIVPLISLGLLMLLRLFCPLENVVVITLFIIMAMPTAAATINFAELYDADSAAAVKTTLLSSILSVLTIPVLMLLLVYI